MKMTCVDGKFYRAFETSDGTVTFQFSDITPTKLGVDTKVVVDAIIGADSTVFRSRLNISSLTGRESFARNLGKVISKEIRWDRYLATACTDLLGLLDSHDTTVLLDALPDTEVTPFIFQPLIVANSINLIFGKGGTSKTYLCLKAALSYASGEDFLGMAPCKTGKTLFVDYETNMGTIGRRLHSLGDVPAGSIRYLPARGVPFHDLLPAIRKQEFDLLIIDSAGAACGGRPEEAETALRFFNAINSLEGVTSIVIAHETKAENKSYCFGSVFFHNAPRNIWNIKCENEQEDKTLSVGLFHRKSSDGALQSPIGVRWLFGENKAEVYRVDLSISWSSEFSVRRQILMILGEHPCDIGTLKEAMPDTDMQAIKSRLSELKKRGMVDNLEGVWCRVRQEISSSGE